MNTDDLIRLRSKIVTKLADLEATTASARATLKESTESIPNFLQDECDAAKGELDLKNATKVYNHSVIQQEVLRSALARMENGTYGNCLLCGVEIDLRRLEAMPGATLCIDCQSCREIRTAAPPKPRPAGPFQEPAWSDEQIQGAA